MGRSRKAVVTAAESNAAGYEYTVVLLPVFDSERSRSAGKPKNGHGRLPEGHKLQGYQVSVPALPGLITYGRTKAEAWSMAQDAIRCHIEGLQKDGERIPNENDTQFRKLRISA